MANTKTMENAVLSTVTVRDAALEENVADLAVSAEVLAKESVADLAASAIPSIVKENIVHSDRAVHLKGASQKIAGVSEESVADLAASAGVSAASAAILGIVAREDSIVVAESLSADLNRLLMRGRAQA